MHAFAISIHKAKRNFGGMANKRDQGEEMDKDSEIRKHSHRVESEGTEQTLRVDPYLLGEKIRVQRKGEVS